MSITKLAIISVAVVVGGVLIVKRALTKNDLSKAKRKIFSVKEENISYDTLISDIRKIFRANYDVYREKKCKLQILNSKPTQQMYEILKKQDPSLSIDIEDKCVSTVLYVDGQIEYVKIFLYKTIDKSLNDIFSSGRDIFEQEID